MVMLDLDLHISSGYDCCIKLKALYDQSKKVPYISEQFVYGTHNQIVSIEMPLKTLKPMIAAWTVEEYWKQDLNFDLHIELQEDNPLIDK